MNRWTTPTAALSSALTALAVLAVTAPSPSALAEDAVPTPFGHNYGESETARSAGLAGAARALGNGTAGLFLNPASIALNRIYHIEGILQTTPEVGRLMIGGAIVDSIMNRYGLAGGLSVAGGFNDAGPADWSTFDLRAALAYPITEKLMIGVAPRYASITHAIPDDKPKEDPEGDLVQLNLHTFTLDAGVTIRATDALHVGFVAQNVVSNHRGTYPTLLGGGIGFGSDRVSVEVDGLADLDSYEGVKMRLMGGGELLLGDHFPIRLGYRFDQGAESHAISAGLGYIGTTFGLEASVRRTLSGPGATTVVVGLAYYVETAGFMKSATEGFDQ